MSQPHGPARDSGRVTILDVAHQAGVSATTVSHVLSGKRLVAAATRERVEQAVRELGYRPNHVARNLRTRRSHMIAVVVPDITNPFYSVLTRGLADAVLGGDYGSYVCNTDGRVDRERTFIDDVMDRGVDGVVIASVNTSADQAAAPVRYGTPVVCLGESIDHPEVDQVRADDGDGSCAATLHLLSRGAERVAMIRGPAHSGGSRVQGYARALTEAGRDYDERYTVAGDWTRPGRADGDAQAHAHPAAARRGLLRQRPDGHRGTGRRPRARPVDPGRRGAGRLRRHRRRRTRQPFAHDGRQPLVRDRPQRRRAAC